MKRARPVPPLGVPLYAHVHLTEAQSEAVRTVIAEALRDGRHTDRHELLVQSLGAIADAVSQARSLREHETRGIP